MSDQLSLESVSGQDSDPRGRLGAAQGPLQCSGAPSAPPLLETLSTGARLPPLRPRPRGRRSGRPVRKPARQGRASGTPAAGAAPVKGTRRPAPTGSPAPHLPLTARLASRRGDRASSAPQGRPARPRTTTPGRPPLPSHQMPSPPS